VVSDHCALLLKVEQIDWGPKPFRNLDAWNNFIGFTSFVESKWKSYSMDGSRIFVLKEKLKFLKRDLKVWNKEVLGT